MREKLLGCLHQIAASKKSTKYDREKAEQAEYEIILAYEGEEEAEEYINDHLGNSEFRETAIETAISRNDLDRAIELCLEGEEADNELPGLVEKWKKSRFHAYELMGDINSQKRLALEFIKDSDYSYFLKYKQLVPADEWKDALEDILDVYGGLIRQSMHERIMINEGLKDRLLQHCKENVSYIANYFHMLLPEYEQDASFLFIEHVKSQARKAANKEQFMAVRQLLESYSKGFGRAKGYALRNFLVEAYSNRPAFREELGKAKLE
jgi:hypothetical protein